MTIPTPKVYVGFGSTWLTEPGSITWTDVTAQVMDRRQPVSICRGSSAIHGEPDTGELSLTLRNHDRLFDPLNTAGTHYGDLVPGVPIKVEVQVTSTLTWDGDVLTWDGDEMVWVSTVIPVWWGSVKSWPQRYDRGNQTATVPLVAYDGFDKLSRAKIPRSVMESAIVPLGPVGYWPLNDPSGSLTASDVIGRNFGTVVDEPDFGTTELAPGLGSCVEFDGVNDRIDVGEHALVPDPNTTGASIMAVFSTSVPADTASIHPIYLQLDGNNADTSHQLFVDTDGSVAHWVSTGGFGTVRSHSTLVDDGATHLVIGVGGPGTDGIAVDSADLEAVVVVGFPQGGSGSAIGGTPNATAGYDDNYFPGRICHVAVWNYELDLTERQSLVDAYGGLAGQTTDDRIGWILDELGWPAGLRDLEVGRTELGPAAFVPGDNALEYLRLVSQTEDGSLTIGPDGSVRFLDRFWRYLDPLATVSQVTFTDDGTDVSVSEFEIEPADDELLVNVARFTRRGGTQQVAVDATSRAAYGEAERSLSDLLHGTDNEVLARAQWTVATRSTPVPHVPRATVNLHALSASDQVVILGLDIGHRVTCTRTPQGVGTAFTVECVVAGIRHEVTAATWITELYLSPAPDATVSLFTLGTSTLGGVDCLAY